MNLKIALLVSAGLVGPLTVSAEARIDYDDGYNFPRFTTDRGRSTAFRAPSYYLINRPFQQR